MRNTQNEKYTFVEAALPVIWFQVPLKRIKSRHMVANPRIVSLVSPMAVTIDT